MKEKVAQTILKNAGLYKHAIDGKFGGNSCEAARKFYDFSELSDDKLYVAVIQVACIRKNITVGEIDGLWGQKTQAGYEKLLVDLKMTDEAVKVSQIVQVTSKYNDWPKQDYNSMVAFYGGVGENQTQLTLPYPMVLEWDASAVVKQITCHTKVKDSLERILKNTLTHYGHDAIKELHLDVYAGCLNVRKMRGGTSWSNHAWGTALDLDSNRNQLKWGKDKAFFARGEYLPFWKIVEAEGWVSLGRARNYDWMHFAAVKL